MASPPIKRPFGRVFGETFAIAACGYTVFNRTFSYVGLPAARIFLGEALLGACLLFRGKQLLRTFNSTLAPDTGSKIRSRFRLFLLFGTTQVILGIVRGHPSLEVLRDSAFVYYSIYLLIGVTMGSTVAYPVHSLQSLSTLLASLNGLYGLAFLGILNRFSEITIPGTPDVLAFPQPSGSGISVLLLIALGNLNLHRKFLLIVNTVVMFGIQVRAEWLACLSGVLVLSLLRKSIQPVVRVALVGFAVLMFAYAIDLRLPGVQTRGGEISVKGFVARVVAPIDPETAGSLSEHSELHEGTFMWRTIWWLAIFERSMQSLELLILGNGFGFDLAGLVEYGESTGLGGLRTPHSFIAFALGYTGIVGLVLFLLLQAAFIRFYIARGKVAVQSEKKLAFLGAAFVVYWLTFGAFSPAFETPYGAIPYYLGNGFLIGSLSRRGASA